MIKSYEQIYKKIYKLVPELDKKEVGKAFKLRSEGYMDLNIGILSRDKDNTVITMSHHYEAPSGEMIPDPKIEIKIHHNSKAAEALSFQDIYGYRQVYPKEGFINLTAKTELNHFLNYWLNNIKTQGFEQENNPNKNTGRSHE